MKTSYFKQNGVSLVEVLVATSILSVVIFIILNMVTFALNQKSRAVSRTVQEKILQNLAADLRADSSIYQKNFSPSTIATAQILKDENLPYRWSDQNENICDSTDPVYTNNNPCCPGCTGKMGFTIRPIEGMPGIFMATVRLTHPAISGGEQYYEIIVVPK